MYTFLQKRQAFQLSSKLAPGPQLSLRWLETEIHSLERQPVIFSNLGIDINTLSSYFSGPWRYFSLVTERVLCTLPDLIHFSYFMRKAKSTKFCLLLQTLYVFGNSSCSNISLRSARHRN